MKYSVKRQADSARHAETFVKEAHRRCDEGRMHFVDSFIQPSSACVLSSLVAAKSEEQLDI